MPRELITEFELDYSLVRLWRDDIPNAHSELKASGYIDIILPLKHDSFAELLHDIIHELVETAMIKRGFAWAQFNRIEGTRRLFVIEHTEYQEVIDDISCSLAACFPMLIESLPNKTEDKIEKQG